MTLNAISYDFSLTAEANRMSNERRLLRFILACLAASGTISVALAAYNGEKENNFGWAVTTSICFSICESALSTFIFLKVEDELRFSFSKCNQEISKESRSFSLLKNSVSFFLSLSVAIVCYALAEFSNKNTSSSANKLLEFLSILYFMTRVFFGFNLLFNYLRKISLPVTFQRVICHHLANIDRTFPNFIGPIYNKAQREKLYALKDEFYDDSLTVINIPLWQIEKLERYQTDNQNENYIFLKKSIPLLTFILVISINIPILLFSLQDTKQTAQDGGIDEEIAEVLFSIISFPSDVIIDCYMINKLLYSLLDIVYDEASSDYIARNYPIYLKLIVFCGLLFSGLSVGAYKYYPFCETLQAMAVSNSVSILGYIATVIIASIEHIFSFLEISKMIFKFYVARFSCNDDEKDKLRIFEISERIKFTITRISQNVDISTISARFNDKNPQNIFERGVNNFFHKTANENQEIPLLRSIENSYIT